LFPFQNQLVIQESKLFIFLFFVENAVQISK
jgi:hypothetical protein